MSPIELEAMVTVEWGSSMNKLFDHLKAKAGLLLIGLIWGSLIVLMLPLMLLAFAVDKITGVKTKEGWLYSILLAQDHLTHAIIGGYFKTTVSAQLGHMSDNSKTALLMANFVDWGFKVATGEIGHCKNAMQKEDLFYFSIRKALAGALFYLVGLFYILLIIVILILKEVL